MNSEEKCNWIRERVELAQKPVYSKEKRLHTFDRLAISIPLAALPGRGGGGLHRGADRQDHVRHLRASQALKPLAQAQEGLPAGASST